MDKIWEAIDSLGNLLIGIGTIFIGLAAYLEAKKPRKK